MGAKEKYERIVNGTRDFFAQSGYRKAVLGLSGGLDSTLTAFILKDALGKENVFGVMIAEAGITSSESIENAVKVANALRINFSDVRLNEFLLPFRKLKWDQGKNAEMNTKARLRMCILYNYANSFNALVAGTSNKSELMLGYGTKFGDLAADVMPLGGLFKSGVIELAKFKEVPEEIIKRKPTAELRKGQSDEKELGASYHTIDVILSNHLERGLSLEELKQEFNAGLVAKIMKRMDENRHKLQTPRIIEPGE